MKQIPYLSILICSFFTLTFSSCTYKYFAPRDSLGLQVNEKGDLKVAGSFSSLPGDALSEESQSGHQYTAQVAYSPLPSLAVAGNFSQVKSSEILLERNNLTKAYAAEAAVGSYLFLNTREDRKIGFLIDFYGGYGMQHVNNSYELIDTASFNAHKFYFQTGFYLVNRSPMQQKKFNFSLGFTIKAGSLSFNKGTFLIKEAFYSPIDQGEEITNFNPQSYYRFSETSVNFQMGVRPVMLYTTLSISTSAAPEFLRYYDNTVKVGLVLELGDLLSKTESPKVAIVPNADKDIKIESEIEEETKTEPKSKSSPKVKKSKKEKQRDKARAKALKAKEKAKKKREKEKAKQAKKRAKLLKK